MSIDDSVEELFLHASGVEGLLFWIGGEIAVSEGKLVLGGVVLGEGVDLGAALGVLSDGLLVERRVGGRVASGVHPEVRFEVESLPGLLNDAETLLPVAQLGLLAQHFSDPGIYQ